MSGRSTVIGCGWKVTMPEPSWRAAASARRRSTSIRWPRWTPSKTPERQGVRTRRDSVAQFLANE